MNARSTSGDDILKASCALSNDSREWENAFGGTSLSKGDAADVEFGGEGSVANEVKNSGEKGQQVTADQTIVETMKARSTSSDDLLKAAAGVEFGGDGSVASEVKNSGENGQQVNADKEKSPKRVTLDDSSLTAPPSKLQVLRRESSNDEVVRPGVVAVRGIGNSPDAFNDDTMTNHDDTMTNHDDDEVADNVDNAILLTAELVIEKNTNDIPVDNEERERIRKEVKEELESASVIADVVSLDEEIAAADRKRRKVYVYVIIAVGMLVVGGAAAVGGVLVATRDGRSNKSPKESESMSATPTAPPTTYQEGGRTFKSTQQLYEAVDDYQQALMGEAPEISDVALRYGYPIGTWNVSMLTNFSRVFEPRKGPNFTAFRGAEMFSRWFNEDLSGWDLSNAVTIKAMFGTATNFTGSGLEYWDVGRVKDFSWVFSDCSSLEGHQFSGWNTSSATNMQGMFYHAGLASKDIDLSGWQVDKVESFEGMFAGTQFSGGGLSSWKTSAATTMTLMFYLADSFTDDLSKWNTSRVERSDAMFSGTTFNGDISAWDVSSLVITNAMFADSSFNRDISSWRLEKNMDASGMFRRNMAFNQSLCSWGQHLPANAKVVNIFDGTACPDTGDPLLPDGPFCFKCSVSF